MKQQSNKLKMYDAPRIKVVSFTIEQGFGGSFKSQAVTPSQTNLGLEDVTESESNRTLTGYFN